jgi:hypothetical protein
MMIWQIVDKLRWIVKLRYVATLTQTDLINFPIWWSDRLTNRWIDWHTSWLIDGEVTNWSSWQVHLNGPTAKTWKIEKDIDELKNWQWINKLSNKQTDYLMYWQIDWLMNGPEVLLTKWHQQSIKLTSLSSMGSKILFSPFKILFTRDWRSHNKFYFREKTSLLEWTSMKP